MLFHVTAKLNPITPKCNYTATAIISGTLDFMMILETNPQNWNQAPKNCKIDTMYIH